MTHFAVLRHQFDVHRNPDRLGPISDDRFCLTMNPGAPAPSDLVGNVAWLVSWEGFMKTHHIVVGWFAVSHVEKRQGVVAHQCACGNEGVLFQRGLGPLDMHAWFHDYVADNRRFREGEPSDLGRYVDEVVALVRSSGYPTPATTTTLTGPAPV
jgi:hypothetical protein